MFKLRKLESKDAELMLEWMHDEDVVKDLKNDFLHMTIENCKSFIESSQNEEKNIHYAIVDENDEYLGTVSLKNVNRTNSCAEFAITIRKKAMGTGSSSFAIKEIIRLAFEKYSLNKVYWYVDKKNCRAIKFYDKNGYDRVKFSDIENILNDEEDNENYLWYLAKK